MAVIYLNPDTIIAKRETQPPFVRTATGYGGKLPTRWELQLKDKRWRRV